MKRLFLLILLLVNFSLHAQIVPDTTKMHQAAIQKLSDSLSALPGSGTLQQAQKIRIIKKEIDFPTSIKLALGMMAFIALMFFSTQSWNPSGING